MLGIACNKGQLAMVQWIASEFTISVNEANDVFADVCTNGHLDLAQWFARDFAITDDIANEAFRGACIGKHIDVMRWLISRNFPIRANIASNELEMACCSGNSRVACFIVRECSVTNDAPEKYVDAALSCVRV